MLGLEIILGGVLLIWCGLGLYSLWSTRGFEVLRPRAVTLPQAPKVSIILSGRDEEETLPAALESLLKLDYPVYEVILVDDDSTDRSGLIADEWAARPELAGRLKVIHNHELPSGWRGKVHALSLAARESNGEWILATDADVAVHPSALRLAMDIALRRDVQLLSLAPEFVFESFFEKVLLPAFSFLLLMLFPVRLVNDPASSRALAAGAFILMRSKDLKELGGYERLRSTLVEDLRMAELFKRNGRRIYLAFTRDLLRTRMYKDLSEIWEGLTRTAFEGIGFSVARIVAAAILGGPFTVLPWAAAVSLLLRDVRSGHFFSADPALLLALGSCAASSLIYLPVVVLLRISPLYVFTLPLATVTYSAAAVNSAWKSVVGGGVSWKGRRYKPGSAGE